LRLFFRDEFRKTLHHVESVHIGDHRLAWLARIGLWGALLLIGLRILGSFMPGMPGFNLLWIALAAAVPILVGSRRRLEIVRHIDWKTLAFFTGMFVLMQAVWDTGFFQRFFGPGGVDFVSTAGILGSSVFVSQFVSNVPFVALSLPLIADGGGALAHYLTLAAGSTLAGNLLLLGAASNIIIVQNAERHGATIGFLAFARIGIPLTLVQVGVFWLWFSLV